MNDYHRDFMCDWTPSPMDDLLRKLADEYHERTEAYDRTVCSAKLRDGTAMPVTPRELGLINRNALMVLRELEGRAVASGADRKALMDAIRRTEPGEKR
jgi:hypothetical protein